VAALRKKLEINVRAPVHIITVHGLGYKFVG
jgi:DNA-binding response OmpR family regulator